MISFKELRNATLLGLVFLFAGVGSTPQTMAQTQQAPAEAGADVPDREWRTWTNSGGAEIEAYLTEVRSDEIVIVRRDGQEFAVPLERFSEKDRQYVSDWVEEQLPSARRFAEIDFTEADPPDSHMIEEVEHTRPSAGEPLEASAVRIVLNYHNIDYDDTVLEQIAVRETIPEEFIPPRDLANALRVLPVETTIVASDQEDWESTLTAIQTAVSWNLPVIVGYRPFIEEETPAAVGVLVGYDQRNIHLLEPNGSSRPARADVRDIEEQFAHAFVIFPKPKAIAGVEPEETELSAAFLNRVTKTLRQVPEFDPESLVEFMNTQGLDATLDDVNHSDIRDQLGQTRSFAREGGLPLIDRALDRGRVVVVPQEYNKDEVGFALIYGQGDDDSYRTVEVFPNRSFERGAIPRAEIARRWLTRDDRIYRLDLIEVAVPAAGAEPESARDAKPESARDAEPDSAHEQSGRRY